MIFPSIALFQIEVYDNRIGYNDADAEIHLVQTLFSLGSFLMLLRLQERLFILTILKLHHLF